MNTFLQRLVLCTVAASATLGVAAWAVQDSAPADPPADSAAMMKIWQQMNAPGKNHELLARFVGTWDAACTFWLTPSAKPMTGTGIFTCEAIYAGRFVRSAFEGTVMDPQNPLSGTSILGYNNISHKFESFWIDSSTTGMMLATGDASADGKTITVSSTFDDPLTGGKSTAKYVYAWQNDDSFTFTMYRLIADKETKEGQIVYTRKK